MKSLAKEWDKSKFETNRTISCLPGKNFHCVSDDDFFVFSLHLRKSHI